MRAAWSLTSRCRSLVVVAGDLVRRRQDLVHRRVEPAVDAGADQLAADDQHEHRRDERHPEQQRDQLRAEPRERQRPAPLDDQLDDVARQHEAPAPRASSGRRPTARRARTRSGSPASSRRRPVREEQRGDERHGEQQDAAEDQPRVVAERPAAARGERDHRPGRRGTVGVGAGQSRFRPYWMNVNFAWPDADPRSHGQKNHVIAAAACGRARGRSTRRWPRARSVVNSGSRSKARQPAPDGVLVLGRPSAPRRGRRRSATSWYRRVRLSNCTMALTVTDCERLVEPARRPRAAARRRS